MKIIAKYLKHLFDNKGHTELTLLVSNFRHTSMLSELEQDKDYAIEIKEIKSKRSLQQNKYLWALLHELERVTQIDALTWYVHSLEDADAKYEYIWAQESTEDTLKKVFRAIKRIKPQRIKESDGWLYKCYLGSSRFTIAEMNILLDKVMVYCNEHDIQTDERLYE